MCKKILIAYFSRKGKNYVGGNIEELAVGNTEAAVKIIKKRIPESDVFIIDPVRTYSPDYYTCTNEAKDELRSNARPEIKEYPDNFSDYDAIILGYPNWWGTMPMPVWTFIEKYDFTGKTIIPLCTHEGSGMGHSESDIKKLCPNAKVEKGLAIYGGSVDDAHNEIAAWLNKLDI